jgi:chemotaxis protein methyltransferase CheR
MTENFEDSEQLSDALFRKISRFVYDYAGINLTENKRELVRARLGKVIRTRGMKGYRHYYEYMSSDDSGEAVRELLNAVSTNLTSFFRESKHFDFITQSLVPELAAEAKRHNSWRIRAWSAGCSSGEEPYSIAMTLLEALPEAARWDIKILASDIDTNMVACAASGIYEARAVTAIPAPLLKKYFQRSGEGEQARYQVKPEVKERMAFRYLNLMEPWPFKGHFDFIFCRNVMIYFDKATQERLVNNFCRFLRPGGHLFIGHSEGLSGVNHEFKYVKPTIYRKPG